jgi:hypothetical protein
LLIPPDEALIALVRLDQFAFLCHGAIPFFKEQARAEVVPSGFETMSPAAVHDKPKPTLVQPAPKPERRSLSEAMGFPPLSEFTREMRALLMGIRGGPARGQPVQERQHFFKCQECGQAIDRRSLYQVLHHEEAGHQRLTDSELTELSNFQGSKNQIRELQKLARRRMRDEH